jgi:hypothetical protein
LTYATNAAWSAANTAANAANAAINTAMAATANTVSNRGYAAPSEKY